MALQLIYTSAPRSLEAGRTGFGTVARHRAVSGLLVSAVERISQFGRAPGQNPRRVVLSHRIVHAGAGSYHVFSCIRDAGSDYTGRTNHIAHHLIAEAREARSAAEAGLTPADILRQMPWRKGWAESPRFFEPSEEISLTQFRPNPSIGAWQRITGNATHAHLVAHSQRCLLLLPDEEGALALFSESLSKLPGLPAWLVTFTTQVEPGDDLVDLRWLALAADSPQRLQVESASRITFDLTDPARLPSPRRPDIKAASSAVTPVATWSQIHTARLDEQRSAIPLPPLFSEDKPRQANSPWPYVVAAALIALLGIGSFFFVPRLPSMFAPRARPAETAISLTQAIDALWQKHRLHLPETQNWLKAEADPVLFGAHQETLNQILAAIREPLRPTEMRVPPRMQDDFTDLITSFRTWQTAVQLGVRDPQWLGEDPHELLASAQVALRRMKEAWDKVKFAFRGVPEMPDTLATEIHTQVLKHLRGSSAPSQGTPNQWQAVLALTRTQDSPSIGWIHAWERLAQSANPVMPAQRQELQDVANFPDTPSWLRQQIQQRLHALSTEMPPRPAARINSMGFEPATGEPALPADGPESLHPRFIVIESPLLPLAQAMEKLPPLPVEPDMQIFMGRVGENASALIRLRQLGAVGVYRRSFNDPNTLEFHQRRLMKLPQPNAPTRLLVRSAQGSQTLFEVIVLPQTGALTDAWPTSKAFAFQSEVQGGQTRLDLKASAWLNTLMISENLPLRLQDVHDPSRRYRLHRQGHHFQVEADLSSVADGNLKTKLIIIDQELETLRQSLRIDEQRRSSLASTNLARAQKEEQAKRLDDSLATRQQRLLQLEEDRKGLVDGTPQSLGLPTGAYSLFAGSRRLCELHLNSPP
jgi:hypothetical protein